MAVKRVLIIYNEKYIEDDIRDILKQEEFPFYFKFANTLYDKELETYINETDEVWTFGHVEHMYEYQMSVEKGCDIWVMG